MTEAASTSYDQVPYTSYAFDQTHPDRLATIATLFGLSPPPVERCRVLELGCASGGNLIPLAVALAEGSYLGLDLSERQVAEGREVVRALRLTNVELRALSILDVDDNFGKFDYLICHGVYSWVPPAVQDKILDLCARNLTPDGVAYVSYNVYPGWHMRGMIRDMMLYHAGPVADPNERVGQARALLRFLVESCEGDTSPYRTHLRQELESLSQASDAYLFHEHLEDCNQPLYFHQFLERVEAKGLTYLGEADFSSMTPVGFSPRVQQTLRQIAPDQVHLDQYLDFLRNRLFRQTLLCGGHQRPNYNLQLERLTRFHVASPLRPAAPPDLRSTAAEKFEWPGNKLAMQLGEPIIKAAFVHLAELWPQAVPFDELRAAARARLGSPAGVDPAELARQDTRALAQALFQAFSFSAMSMVELHVSSPPFTLTAGPRPVASPLARLQARAGDRVTNLKHNMVGLGNFQRRLLVALDGTLGRDELVERMSGHIVRGEVQMEHQGRPVTDPEQARTGVRQILDQHLNALARCALLVA